MENNNDRTIKQKLRAPFSKKILPVDGNLVSNSNRWSDISREHQRESGEIRKLRKELKWDQEQNYYGKKEHFKDEDNCDQLWEDQQLRNSQNFLQAPRSTFPNYDYNALNYNPLDYSYVDNNRPALLMTPYVREEFIPDTKNSKWNVGSLNSTEVLQSDIPVNPRTSNIPMSSKMGMMQNPLNINSSTYTGLSENTYGMVGMKNWQYEMINMPENMVHPVKGIIQLSKSVLYPPSSNTPPPPTKNKPLGCKTVFVNGLPEKITENILREVFEKCGEIRTICLSKMNFCHIRFASEVCVENAIFFSGYKIKIENRNEGPFTGILHVDYAQSKDDEEEYYEELHRKEKELHNEKHAEEFPRADSPILHYTLHKAAAVCEELRDKDKFQQALHILITWLKSGECNKKTSSSFYSMIQSANSHVRKLISEKEKCEEELNKAKLKLEQQMQCNLVIFNEFQKVFAAAADTQKVRDQFTKAQRKNIEMWKKHIEEVKKSYTEELLNERMEDEMDMSDDDMNKNASEEEHKGSFSEQQKNKLEETIRELHEKNDALNYQLEAVKNEKILMQYELKANEQNESNSKVINNSLQEKEMLVNTTRENEIKEKELCSCKKRKLESCVNSELLVSSSSSLSITENDTRLVSLISTFLLVHPMGASIDYICSFLCQFDKSINAREIESLMKRFPTVFKEKCTGIGASLEKKWTYCGFDTNQ